jgi:membrane protein implicated in regulation of membrane protease activity
VTLDRAMTWFIGVWVGLVVLINVVAMIGFMMGAPTVWAGIAQIQDIYSPFNVRNWMAEVIAVSPAVAVLAWQGRRRSRAASQPRK